MKLLLTFFSCLLFSSSLTAQTSNFTVQHNTDVHWYGIHVDVDPSVRYLSAHVQSIFTMRKTDDIITWDFTNELLVDSIINESQRMKFKQMDNDKLIVYLEKSINIGKEGKLDIYYHGIPPIKKIADNDSGFAFITSKHKNQSVLFTVNEPFGAMQWWPTHNDLSDKADSVDIFITHPAIYKASANGKLQSEVQSDNKITTHFKHRYPVASYLIAFAVSNYKVFERTAIIGNKKLPIITYVYPENLKAFETNIDALVNAMEKFSKVFGEYPFMNECYTQTQVSGAGGMEHQTNSFVDDSNINLQNHELAHQWFGNKVTHNSWSNIWLKEGAAVYCADYLYPLLCGNKDEKNKIAQTIKDWLKYVTSANGGSIYAKDSTNIERLFDGRLSYVKPAFVYRMLQKTVGDSAFFKGIYNYLNDKSTAYNFVSPKNLQQHLEQTSGMELDDFFKQWIYGEGYPTFNVKWKQQKNRDLKIKINQKTSNASIGLFKVKLPIQLIGEGMVKNYLVDFDRNDMISIIKNVRFKVTKIVFDPEHWFISKNNKVVGIRTFK
jgi:aminopeptidase N